MNRSDLRTEVIGITNRSDKTTLINNAINLALEDLYNRHDWFEARSQTDTVIAAGDYSVSLPSANARLLEARVLDVSDERSVKLDIRHKNAIIDRYPYPETMTQSWPRLGYTEGGSLFFYPPADDAYTIRMTSIAPQQLSDDVTDIALLGLRSALVSYACAHVYLSLEMLREADYWRQRYEAAYLVARRSDERRVADFVQTRLHQGQSDYRSDTERQLDPFTHGGH